MKHNYTVCLEIHCTLRLSTYNGVGSNVMNVYTSLFTFICKTFCRSACEMFCMKHIVGFDSLSTNQDIHVVPLREQRHCNF